MELDVELAALVRRRIAAFVNQRASPHMTHEEVCDFCSHGFEHAVVAFHKWDPTQGVPLGDYMVWYGCNRVMDAFRHWTLHRQLFKPVEGRLLTEWIHGHDPLQGLAHQELHASIRTLPPKLRTLLHTHYWQDVRLAKRGASQKPYRDHQLALRKLRHSLKV